MIISRGAAAGRTDVAYRHLAAIVEYSDDAILSRTLEGTVLTWNPGAERLYGFGAEEVVGRPIDVLVPPDRRDELPSIDERLRRGDRVEPFETVRVRKDGTRIDVSISISPLKDDGGRVVAASTIARDITDQKRSDTALRRANEELERRVEARTAELSAVNDRLRSHLADRARAQQELEQRAGSLREQAQLLELAHDAIVVRDPRTDAVLFWNRRAEEMYGWSASDALGQPAHALLGTVLPGPPDQIGEILHRDGRWEGEVGQTRRDGTSLRVESRWALQRDEADGPVAVLEINRDVTARRETERQLRERGRRYRELAAASVRQAQELALLDRVRTALARELELPALCRTVVEATAQTFGYTLVSLYLVEDDDLRLQHQVGYHQVLDRVPLSRGVMGRVARTGEPVLLADVRGDPDFLSAAEDVVSEVCVPLRDRGRVVGVVNLESRRGVTLGEADLRLMTALAEHIGVAAGRARLYAEIRAGDERFHAAFDDASIGMALVGVDGRWLHVNHALCELVGRDRAGLLARTFRDIAHPEDLETHLTLMARVADGELRTYQREMRCQAGDGATVWALLSVSLVRDEHGGPLYFVAQMQDITERKRAEDERAALLAAEREYARRLTDLAALKADFTAMVAHELGSPIAAVRGLLDMVATGDLTAEEQRQALEAMRTEAAVLHTLLRDVQAITTVERDDFAVHPVPVTLRTLLAGAAASARALPGAHPIVWPTDAEGSVLADPVRIAQVLHNLLGNATKYSPDGTTIELRATRRGAKVRIEVRDRGPGIAAADRGRIFEKYQRARRASDPPVAGLGVGLYVSRRIVQAHGSDLAVEPRAGGGSVFAFELDLVAEGPPDPATGAEPDQPGGR